MKLLLIVFLVFVSIKVLYGLWNMMISDVTGIRIEHIEAMNAESSINALSIIFAPTGALIALFGNVVFFCTILWWSEWGRGNAYEQSIGASLSNFFKIADEHPLVFILSCVSWITCIFLVLALRMG